MRWRLREACPGLGRWLEVLQALSGRFQAAQLIQVLLIDPDQGFRHEPVFGGLGARSAGDEIGAFALPGQHAGQFPLCFRQALLQLLGSLDRGRCVGGALR